MHPRKLKEVRESGDVAEDRTFLMRLMEKTVGTHGYPLIEWMIVMVLSFEASSVGQPTTLSCFSLLVTLSTRSELIHICGFPEIGLPSNHPL